MILVSAMTIVWSVVILAGLGLIFGLGLAIAAKVFHVEVDTRIEDIAAILPQANCGACGFPGCNGFAEAIVNGKADNLSQCKPGSKSGKPEAIRKYLDEHPNPDGSINPIKVK
ncbi:MAG: RnfABCDGE type electron transport complex subunit B [Acholeplasmatales bacterium]|nr:RnfABCDGE type electron transport complex subunit B [Acholeplasmatales bacterium]